MTYAIVQKELVVPDVELLTRAFCTQSELTRIDARNAASDAYGILWRGLDIERAGALQAALNHEGVPTEMIRESEFPTLSTGRVVRQVQFTAGHLLAYDPMQRVVNIPWGEILLIAAGQVRRREARRARGLLEETGTAGSAHAHEEEDRLVIDLFLIDGTTRFTMAADEFNFGHLEQRLSGDVTINHLFLVQELEDHAPHASLNQGAFLACQKPPQIFRYPSKHAYQEEIIWLLWRLGRIAAESGGGSQQ